MLNKNDIERIAGALKQERPGNNWNSAHHVQWNNDVKALARLFDQRQGFDKKAFFNSCGGLCIE